MEQVAKDLIMGSVKIGVGIHLLGDAIHSKDGESQKKAKQYLQEALDSIYDVLQVEYATEMDKYTQRILNTFEDVERGERPKEKLNELAQDLPDHVKERQILEQRVRLFPEDTESREKLKEAYKGMIKESRLQNGDPDVLCTLLTQPDRLSDIMSEVQQEVSQELINGVL